MNRLIFLFAVLLCAACGRTFEQRTAKYAEVRELHDHRAAVRDASEASVRWGFVDAEGSLAIECRYVAVGNFSEQLAAAQLPGGVFGYIGTDGTWAVDPAYRSAGDFAEGMAWVMNLAGLWGRIDTCGRALIPCLYDEVPSSFSDGLLLVRAEQKEGLLRTSGEVVAPCIYDQIGEPGEQGWMPVLRGGKRGFLDLAGDEVVACKYDRIAEPGPNGLIAVAADGKYGFLRVDGAEILPCDFSYISDFKGGYAQANYGGSMGLHEQPFGGLWGLVDTLGKLVVPCRYADLGEPSEGVVACRTDVLGNYGYVDVNDQVIITPRYAVARPFHGGVAVVSYNNVDFGVVDMNGNEQSSFRYKIIGKFSDGLAPFNLDPSGMNFQGMERRCGFLDLQGREIIPVRYDDARPFSERRAAVMRFGVHTEDFLDARWSYITPSGELITNYKYHEAHPFSCGLARVFIKGQGYGFIDRKGREVVPCKYLEAEDYADFRTRVKEPGHTLVLDEKGQVVSEE